MNKIFIYTIFIFFINSCSKNNKYPWYTYKDLDHISKIETNKLVLIDFETDW